MFGLFWLLAFKHRTSCCRHYPVALLLAAKKKALAIFSRVSPNKHIDSIDRGELLPDFWTRPDGLSEKEDVDIDS